MPRKSQGKFFRATNFRKSIKILIKFKYFGFLEDRYHGKFLKTPMKIQGKLEKVREKAGTPWLHHSLLCVLHSSINVDRPGSKMSDRFGLLK